MNFRYIFILYSFIVINQASAAKDVLITQFGAKADNYSVNTKAIQSAIDQVHADGGGRVIVPAGGVFISGSIFIKSNVELHLELGAVLKASTNRADYAFVPRPLFYYERLKNHPLGFNRQHFINIINTENVVLSGGGIIDGSGRAFWKPFNDEDLPFWIEAEVDRVSNMVEAHGCKNLKIRDISLKNSPEWTVHLYNCDNVWVDAVTIDNGLFGPNNDGIDITSSRNVHISNCRITTCDDAICLKSAENGGVCESIVVTNCVIQTSCVGLKIGSETHQDIRNVTMSNCVITQSSRAIGIYSVHGGSIEHILFQNIVANTNAPLVLNRPIQIMQHKAKDKPVNENVVYKPGKIKNVKISNFTCETQGRIFITADDGEYLDDIELDGIYLKYPIIENPKHLSMQAVSSHFAPLNTTDKTACATIIARNINGFSLKNLQVRWPELSMPTTWIQHQVLIENGSEQKHLGQYGELNEVGFQVFFGNHIKGGELELKNLNSSKKGTSAYSLFDCKVKIK